MYHSPELYCQNRLFIAEASVNIIIFTHFLHQQKNENI